MGMFDYVKHSAPCTECEKILTEWQSKDGPCELSTLDPCEVEHFYTFCDGCHHWNEYDVVLDAPKPRLPYHLVVVERRR